MRVLLALAVLLLAGCGTSHEIAKQADEVHSVAAEGALLAHEAAEGDTRETFAREHATALRKRLDQLRPAIEESRLMTLADDVDHTLAELARAPGDRTRAAGAERQLERDANAADELAKMNRIFGVALGILAAIGGFVDIGDIVFNVAAGATFGYQLLWAVVIGVGGIITYAEMCGRVAAVSGSAVMDAVRERLGFGFGLVALVAGQIVNVMTLAAEIGGVAIALQLLSGLSYRALLALAVLAVALVLWLMPFDWIERLFGYCGLTLLVFVVAAVKLHPDWGSVAHGFVPSAGTGNGWVYAYYVVGLVGAAMIPYEVYFYSSGAVEEQWGPKDLGLNRANVLIGYSLGGLLSFALMIAAGAFLLPPGVSAELLGTVALVANAPLGQVGLILGLVGILFAVSGAAIDSAFSGAYNLAQFFGWEWGKYRTNEGAPRFTLTWIGMLLVGFLIVVTGVDPIMVTELSVIAAVVALPLTYVPILLVANDRAYMNRYANGVVANVFGVFYLVVVLAIAVAAIPLLILSNMGQG